jgi:hypothetical protein
METLKCMFGGKVVDCWSCAIIRFVTWMLIFGTLYYLRELIDLLIYHQQVSFELRFKKVLFILAFFSYAVFTSLYADIQYFTKEKRKLKEEKRPPKTPVAGRDCWPNESEE